MTGSGLGWVLICNYRPLGILDEDPGSICRIIRCQLFTLSRGRLILRVNGGDNIKSNQKEGGNQNNSAHFLPRTERYPENAQVSL